MCEGHLKYTKSLSGFLGGATLAQSASVKISQPELAKKFEK